jgi:hypothetical protein
MKVKLDYPPNCRRWYSKSSKILRLNLTCNCVAPGFGRWDIRLCLKLLSGRLARARHSTLQQSSPPRRKEGGEADLEEASHKGGCAERLAVRSS